IFQAMALEERNPLSCQAGGAIGAQAQHLVQSKLVLLVVRDSADQQCAVIGKADQSFVEQTIQRRHKEQPVVRIQAGLVVASPPWNDMACAEYFPLAHARYRAG